MPPTLRAPLYRRRVIDEELDALIGQGASAIALVGAKAVGKSATAAERAAIAFALDDPAVRSLIEAEPALLLGGDSVLIDEWQHLPQSWDVVRRAVDAGAETQFLLTGSASQTNPGTHSGAGPILVLRMRPQSLVERGLAEPTVSLGALLSGELPPVTGTCEVTLSGYAAEIVRSGFPGIRDLSPRLRRGQLAGYVQRVIDRDMAELGRSVRNPAALERWLRAYAASSATTASFETIRDAATSGQGEKPARTTTIPYRDALERLYVLDPIPAWMPRARPINQVAAAPKHHLADPALATTLLGIDETNLLGRGAAASKGVAMLAALFESLVTQSVRIYAQHNEAQVGHLRLHRGEREVDLIVENADGTVVAIEIKLTAAVDDDDVKHLAWLREQIGDDLRDAVVLTPGASAYRRRDGIAVVPAALLGP
ncbi:ATP-binding protein [Sporichthya polymorpha]|uniref:ATP-binding protein n=1 Tax=Sporichthya polymorpha TaxID=35751 RepID=UPI000687F207|nr:DUF4143 domain-containing protein [Sporichthya polymorpha]